MWSVVSFRERIAAIARVFRHADGFGRFALIASSAKTRLLAFVPSVVHVWILRLAVQLPGIDAALAGTIRGYVSGQTGFNMVQTSIVARVAADSNKVSIGPLSLQQAPSTSVSLLAPARRSIAIQVIPRDANKCGQNSSIVNDTRDFSDLSKVFSLPVKRHSDSSQIASKGRGNDVAVDSHQNVDETEATRLVDNQSLWLSRKPRTPASCTLQPTAFDSRPLTGTYFTGGEFEQDDDTSRKDAPSDEFVEWESRLRTLSYVCPSGAAFARSRFELSDYEDDDDDDYDGPFYIVDQLFWYQRAFRELQQQLSPELGSSSDEITSGPDDYADDLDSDKENVPPTVDPISTSGGPDRSFGTGLFLSRPAAHHSFVRRPLAPITSGLFGGSDDEETFVSNNLQLASSGVSQTSISRSNSHRAPLIDLTTSPAVSVHNFDPRADNISYRDDGYDSDSGTDVGSYASSSSIASNSETSRSVAVHSGASTSTLATLDVYDPQYWRNPPTGAIPINCNGMQSYLVRSLGAGAFGRVYLAVSEGGPMAVKIVNKCLVYNYGSHGRDLVLAEAENWRKITESNKPFLARLIGSCDDLHSVYFLMRLHHQTLGDRIYHEYLCQEEVKMYSAELISALASLQELEIIHRDIKPDNIHIAPDGHLVLADFGNSDSPQRGRRNIPFQSLHTWSRAGTPGYWAPEVREWDPRKGAKPSSDVYSLGIVILEMALGYRGMFFAAADEELINEQMRTKPIPFDQIKAVDADLADMLEKMLCDSPAQRWTAEALKEHPYVRDLFELGLESGLVHPSYFPSSPSVPQLAALVKVEHIREPHISWVQPADLAYPRPKDNEVSEEYKTSVLDDLDERPYTYMCPAEYKDITLYGWPAATAQ